MSKIDLSKIAINEENSTFDTEFIINNTNFNNSVDFCHALGIYTLEDLEKINYIPNIDDKISKLTKFKTFEEFLKSQLPKFWQDVL